MPGGGETQEKPSGWTTDTWAQHTRELRAEQLRTDAAMNMFHAERDRRLTEVAGEKEKALRIKDEGVKETSRVKELADLEARQLARDAQTYKDEQANKLRDQIAGERGDYVTNATFQPVADFVTAQVARQTGAQEFRNDNRLTNTSILGWLGFGVAVIVAAVILANALTGR